MAVDARETYRLAPHALTFDLEVENLAEEAAPVMPGLRPCFPLRLVESDVATPEEARQTCAVWVDAGELWARLTLDQRRHGRDGAVQDRY